MHTTEETTFSEELMKELSWKDWIRENRIFLAVIGTLSLLSLILFIENQITVPTQQEISPKPILKPIIKPKILPKFSLKSAPRNPLPKNPLKEAQELFSQGQTQKTIVLLLKIAKEDPNPKNQEEAAALAKHYYQIQEEKEQIKKRYLQGYVLFLNYPKEACEEWSKVLTSSLTEDPYYEKAQRRWKENCHVD